MAALGDLIRETREAKRLSLQTVSSATKIRENVLTALENEAYEDLPAPVYVRGLLRTLARYLEIDADRLLALYKAAVPQADVSDPALTTLTVAPKSETPPPLPTLSRPFWLTPSALVMALVAVLLVAGVTWGGAQVVGGLTQARPTPAAFIAQPTATPPFALDPTRVTSPTPALTPYFAPTPTLLPRSAGFEVKLDISARSWVRVEADGTEVYQGILEAGTSKTFSARTRITLRAGNGGGVTALVNGQTQGPLGALGDVVDRQWVLGENGAVTTTPPTWTIPPGAITPIPQR